MIDRARYNKVQGEPDSIEATFQNTLLTWSPFFADIRNEAISFSDAKVEWLSDRTVHICFKSPTYTTLASRQYLLTTKLHTFVSDQNSQWWFLLVESFRGDSIPVFKIREAVCIRNVVAKQNGL
jgi:hypothetical protein